MGVISWLEWHTFSWSWTDSTSVRPFFSDMNIYSLMFVNKERRAEHAANTVIKDFCRRSSFINSKNAENFCPLPFRNWYKFDVNCKEWRSHSKKKIWNMNEKLEVKRTMSFEFARDSSKRCRILKVFHCESSRF